MNPSPWFVLHEHRAPEPHVDLRRDGSAWSISTTSRLTGVLGFPSRHGARQPGTDSANQLG